MSAIYLGLAEEIGGLISAGKLRAGERLPSVRALSEQRRVSATTAVAVLRELELRGLAEARPQSGYYVRTPRLALAEPAMSRPRARAQKVTVSGLIGNLTAAFERPDAAPLGAALPDPELLPRAPLQRALARLARSRPELVFSYGPPEGSVALRRHIAARYRELGVDVAEGELVITNGCMEAINLALRATCRPGDSVAIESPCYYGFLQVLEALGLKAQEVPTHPREGLSVEALERLLGGSEGRSIKACLLSANNSNPLGATMPDAAKAALARLCRQRKVALIEDDLYGELHYAGPRPLPLRGFAGEGPSLLCSSFSKTVAPGARIGWIAAGALTARVRELKFAGSVTTGGLMQEAIAELMRGSSYARHLRRLRAAAQSQVQRGISLVLEYFPPGTRVAQPAGGFLLWVELPKGTDALRLYERAAAEDIEFAPGALFSASGSFGNALRLACGRVMTPRIERAITRLGQLAHEI